MDPRIIGENASLVESLCKYFPGFQLVGKRWLENSHDPIDPDFVLKNQTYPFYYKGRKGTEKVRDLYLVDLEKMLDINHQEYWGLFPGNLRFPNGGQASSPAYKDFITIARTKLKQKTPFNVFEFFLSAIEGKIKKEKGAVERWKPYLPAFEDDHITERFLKDIATINLCHLEYDHDEARIEWEFSDTSHLEYDDHGKVKLAWDFSGITGHDTDADIYKTFSRYCDRYILLCSLGYDVANYLDGKTLIAPANAAEYKKCIDLYNKENPKNFESIKTFYERGYNLMIYLLSIEKGDTLFADILTYVLEILSEEESAADMAINQAVPDLLDKIRRNYNARARPEKKRERKLPEGQKIGDLPLPKEIKSLTNYNANIRKAYESLFNILIAGYTFRFIFFPYENTCDDIFSNILSVTCKLGDMVRKPKGGIPENFITGDWYNKPEAYALAEKAWKAAEGERFMTPVQIKNILDTYADSGSYKDFKNKTGDFSPENRGKGETPLTREDKKRLEECIPMLASLVSSDEDEQSLIQCIARLVSLPKEEKRQYKAAFRLLKKIDLEKILETSEEIFSTLFSIEYMTKTRPQDFDKIIPCILSRKERETLRAVLIPPLSINQGAYTDNEEIKIGDTIPSDYPGPEEKILGKTEAYQIKPLVVKYLKSIFWESKFKEVRKYLGGMDASELKGLIISAIDKNRKNILFQDFCRLADTGMTEKEFNDKMDDVIRLSVNDCEKGAYTGRDNPYFLSDKELEQPEYIRRIKKCIVDYAKVIFPESRYRTFNDYLEKQNDFLLMDMVVDFTRLWGRHQENDLFKECKRLDPSVDDEELSKKMKFIASRALTDAREFFYNHDELEERKNSVLDKLKNSAVKYYKNLNMESLKEKNLSELYLLMAPFGLKDHYDFDNPLYVQAVGNMADKKKYNLLRKRLDRIDKELYHEQGDQI
jgi:hypothetical protein